MEIRLFQLENLLLTRTGFTFFDLRQDPAEVAELKQLLSAAERVHSEFVEERLVKKAVDKTAPIVLVCDSGELSAKTARRLETSGYQNVYVVTRGVAGLLSEL